jgi:hypothetical protein
MKMIAPDSTWNLPPTGRQTRTIARLCRARGITEPLEERPSNRLEASRLIRQLAKSNGRR